MGKDILVGGRWTQQQEATEKLLADWEAKRGVGEEMWEDHSLEGKRQRLLEWLKEAGETVWWLKACCASMGTRGRVPGILTNGR